MTKAFEIIRDAESLPVEERVAVVESLLRTLNPSNDEVDQQWAAVANRRLGELRTGTVTGVSGDEVFAKVHKRFQ